MPVLLTASTTFPTRRVDPGHQQPQHAMTATMMWCMGGKAMRKGCKSSCRSPTILSCSLTSNPWMVQWSRGRQADAPMTRGALAKTIQFAPAAMSRSEGRAVRPSCAQRMPRASHRRVLLSCLVLRCSDNKSRLQSTQIPSARKTLDHLKQARRCASFRLLGIRQHSRHVDARLQEHEVRLRTRASPCCVLPQSTPCAHCAWANLGPSPLKPLVPWQPVHLSEACR